MNDKLEWSERSCHSLIFAWMDWGKTHGQFRQHRRYRGRD